MLFDTHTHTTHSDGKNSVREMCNAALERGLMGITLSDHADMNFYRERNTLSRMENAIEEIRAAKEEYAPLGLKVMQGIELGEYTYAPEKAEEVLSLKGYDAVLCSVHLVPEAGRALPYNRIDFSDPAISDEEIRQYFKLYFRLLSRTVDSFDFDILAHLHCPARYATGKYRRHTNVMEEREAIEEIMKKLIRRDIALEVNTALLWDEKERPRFQMDEILSLYRSLGGKAVTLGSDAHSAVAVGNKFSLTLRLLKEQGFSSYRYYENRIPHEIPIP